jgi:hypothetical protein
MKRFVLPFGVLLILAGAGIYLQRHMAPHTRQAAGWLPADTILFEDMPDLHRTEERWPDTALAQILAEPEVQSALTRPLGTIPDRARLNEQLARIGRIDPVHFFLAVTSLSEKGVPGAVAGLDYSGSRGDLDALVDQLRKSAQETWPAGKSDVEKYGAGDIETFTTPGFSAALAYRGQWLFLATDAGVLKTLLDHFEGQHDPNTLGELPAFRNCVQHLPPASDNVFFIRPSLLADRISSLEVALNPMGDVHGADGLKKVDAAGLAFKMDGELMRDAAFIISTIATDETPLAKDSLRLSTRDTIVALSNRVQPVGNAQLPPAQADPTGVLQLLDGYLKTFSDQGLGPEQVSKAFGPESGFLLDWPSGAMIPTPLVMMDVRNPALAHRFLETFATLPLAAGLQFSRQDAGGISYYSLPATGIGFFPLQVTLGMTNNLVVGALSMDAVKTAAGRWASNPGRLDGTEPYRKAAALVEEPTTSFSYVDAKAGFGRVYGLFRGLASLGIIPHLGEYVDISKLPAPDTIAKHLSPIVASTSGRDGGLLMESAGPVTAAEGAVAAAVTVGVAAIPFVEQQLKGQSVAIPGFPKLAAPLAPAFPRAPGTPSTGSGYPPTAPAPAGGGPAPPGAAASASPGAL